MVWDFIPDPVKDLTSQATTWLAKSDAIRYWIMQEYGGIYLDTDTIPGNMPLSELPQKGPFTCGLVRKDGVHAWTNFLLGCKEPGDPFWTSLLKRCREGDYTVFHPAIRTIYQYNIEAMLGLKPTVTTVPCWQNRYEFTVPDRYFCKHLSRTNPEDHMPPVTYAKTFRQRSNVISENEFALRQETCASCEFILSNGGCSKCQSCSGRNKSRIREVHCPISKW